MEGLTNEVSLNEIQKLFDLYFDANSLCDRMAYIFSIKYNMVDFANWFHHNICHYFTGDNGADGIEAFGELRQDLFYRGLVPEHKEDYESMSKALEILTLKVKELEDQCVRAIKSCAETNNLSYEDFLRSFNVDKIVPLLKQSIVLYNAVLEYEKNDCLCKWNKDYEAYLLPQFKGGE